MAHLRDHAPAWVTGIRTNMGLTFLTQKTLELFMAALTGTLLLICLSYLINELHQCCSIFHRKEIICAKNSLRSKFLTLKNKLNKNYIVLTEH